MLFDYLFESLKYGGWVLVPIFLVGVLGFYLLLLAFSELRHDIVAGMKLWAEQHGEMTRVEFQYAAKKVWHSNITKLDRHIHLIGVLAAVAPLLGLLGTVSGMVETFVIITRYGNSNPVFMATGISEALVTTQAGLLIAVPLVLCKHQLEDRILWIRKQAAMHVTEFMNMHYSELKI